MDSVCRKRARTGREGATELQPCPRSRLRVAPFRVAAPYNDPTHALGACTSCGADGEAILHFAVPVAGYTGEQGSRGPVHVQPVVVCARSKCYRAARRAGAPSAPRAASSSTPKPPSNPTPTAPTPHHPIEEHHDRVKKPLLPCPQGDLALPVLIHRGKTKANRKSNLRTLLCHRQFPAESANGWISALLRELADYEEAVEEPMGGFSSRALTLQTTAALLQSIPRPLTNTAQLREEKVLRDHLGAASAKKVRQIIESGTCPELTAHRGNGDVRDRQGRSRGVCGGRAKHELSRVLGVGRSNSERIYDALNVKSVGDLRNKFLRAGKPRVFQELLTRAGVRQAQMVVFGIQNYDTLSQPVPAVDVREMRAALRDQLIHLSGSAARKLDPRLWDIVQVGGARRRGTAGGGHDVDFLLLHPHVGFGAEAGEVIASVARGMQTKGVLLKANEAGGFFKFQDGSRIASPDGSYLSCPHIRKAKTEALESAGSRFGLLIDSFPRFFGVFRTRRRALRRLDVIVVPHLERAFAMLAWTGSKLFNRNLRAHCKRHGLMLNSHCIMTIPPKFGFSEPKVVPYETHPGTRAVETEADVFSILGLSHTPPRLRCC